MSQKQDSTLGCQPAECALPNHTSLDVVLDGGVQPMGNSRTLLDMDGQMVRSVRATPLRFVLLIAAASFMFGNYYFFDQTSATETAILEATGMSEITFGLLSSVYSYPNVILPLFGGLLVDYFGVRNAAVFFTGLVFLGSLLFSIGLWSKSIFLMIVARIIFGMGGESQCVTCLTLVSQWFAGRELAFATAIIIAVARLGSVAVFNTQPGLVANLGVIGASVSGTAVCVMSWMCSWIAFGLDKHAVRKDAARGLRAAATGTDEVVRCQDVFKFGGMYWCLTASCVSVFVAAFPFMQVISSKYLKDRFAFEESAADSIVSYINLVSALVSPLLGLFVDHFGRRPMLLVISASILCSCHIGFLLFPSCHQCHWILAPYCLMGVGLSVYGGVIWPCIPLVVDPSTTGTAFGLTTAFQNLGMALSPTILTVLHSSTKSFTFPFLYIIACCIVGILSATGVWIIDWGRGQKLWRA